LEVGTADEFLK